jgi:hypothetical protein
MPSYSSSSSANCSRPSRWSDDGNAPSVRERKPDTKMRMWLAWRWEGNRQVPDETSRVTLPLGADGADVDMPRVTDHYRH